MQRDDEDDAWQAIVANYGERPALDEPALDERSEDGGQDSDHDDAGREDDALPVDGATGTPTEAPAPATPDPDDEFVPPRPEPAPLPAIDRLAGWLGVIGGPAVLVLAALLRIDLPDFVLLLLVAAIIGGFGYLVATMDREPRDPWDDGAEV